MSLHNFLSLSFIISRLAPLSYGKALSMLTESHLIPTSRETKLAKSLCNNLTVKATLELVDGFCAPPFIEENVVT